MTDAPVRILVLCTGNSCRSILAEALFREIGGDRVAVESAGSRPQGTVNPRTIRVLDEAGIGHDWARSKSMTEFLDQEFDHVLTVCDDARLVCPVFPGADQSLHGGYAEPASVSGDDAARLDAFERVFTSLAERIGQFVVVTSRRAVPIGG